MALTDTAMKAAKHGPKPIKLFDERGLFLLLPIQLDDIHQGQLLLHRGGNQSVAI